MGGLELALRRLNSGHKLRFHQDYYGRQWVKVQGGWKFWRNARIYLRNEEMVELKRTLADLKSSHGNVGVRVRTPASA